MGHSRQQLDYYLRETNNFAEENEFFLSLLDRAKKNELTALEAKYFYIKLKNSYRDYGDPLDYLACKEPIFNALFRRYYEDIEGIYPKFDILNRKISPNEVLIELEKLNAYFEEWDLESKAKQTDDFHIQLFKETKEAISKLKERPECCIDGIFYANNFFKSRYKKTILASRYVRNIAQEQIDEFGEKINIAFNTRQVEFNEYSLVHVMFRHYGRHIKQVDTDKSFHKEIDYQRIGPELKILLEEIDKSGLIQDVCRRVDFKYKDTIYTVWISPEKQRSQKGVSGMQNYFRVDTFHPVDRTAELQKILAKQKHIINSKLILYK